MPAQRGGWSGRVGVAAAAAAGTPAPFPANSGQFAPWALMGAKLSFHCRRTGTKLPKTRGLYRHGDHWWVRGSMGRFPALVRYGSKLVLEIMPSVAATVIGGYL